MNRHESHNILKFTIGQWRQAVTGFNILLPEDQYDWGPRPLYSPAELEAMQPIGLTQPTASSEHRAYVMTTMPLDPVSNIEKLTRLTQIGVYYSMAGRLGIVMNWLSKDEHEDIDRKADSKRIQQTACYRETAGLYLDLIEEPMFKDASGNTPVREILESSGGWTGDMNSIIGAASRAYDVIHWLNSEHLDAGEFFLS